MGKQAERGNSGTDLRAGFAHIAALDGVRGTAILLVLVFHLLWSNFETGSRVMNVVVAVRSAGWVGVDLFYALSGFLITGILYDALGGAHYFRNFYLRRVLRIVPLYYAVTLFLFLFVEFRLHQAAGRPFLLLLTYLNNTPLWWHTVSGKSLIDLTNHLWSLAVEEQFYFVWPFVVFALRDRRRLMWAAAGLAVMAPATRAVMIAHGAGVDALYKMTVCRADSLLGGAWVALAVRGGLRERVLRWAPVVFGVALAGCLAIAVWGGNFDYERNPAVRSVGFSLVALAGAAWVAMALRAGWVARSMSAGWLRFLGKYSYGIYVFHIPVDALVALWLMPVVRAHVHSKAVLHLLELGLAVGLTVPLAMLSFAFYEKPLQRLKRYFPESRGAGAVMSPSMERAGTGNSEGEYESSSLRSE